MARSHVVTRPAAIGDLPTLIALWDELRRLGGRAERAVNPLTPADVPGRLTDLISDASCRVQLALVADEPAGMAVMRIVQPDPLSEGRVLQIAHLVVARSHRRNGVGHALVSAAADFAAEHHLDHVGASVYPSLRDASRFFARLGFAPVAVRRVVPVTVLRRRLGKDASTPLMGDAARRRTRLIRPVPPQRARRSNVERIES